MLTITMAAPLLTLLLPLDIRLLLLLKGFPFAVGVLSSIKVQYAVLYVYKIYVCFTYLKRKAYK